MHARRNPESAPTLPDSDGNQNPHWGSANDAVSKPGFSSHRAVYDALAAGAVGPSVRAASREWLQEQLASAAKLPCTLPNEPEQLLSWMHESAAAVGKQYTAYLEQRKAGAPRRYFRSRAHALAFLREVAPTKLVDGAWLYGLLEHWNNPRYGHLVRTYVEELGDGRADRNHVLLYRQLLATQGIGQWQDLQDDRYTQGAIQLALAQHGNSLLPEVVGFNLGYEQLPLHLHITAYELNELGIDPYYFTLHVTVDNGDSGHARRAVSAVMDAMPRFGDREAFWKRVRTGFMLNDLGAGTVDVIKQFDIDAEVVRIFRQKAGAGRQAHSDYCKIGGRSVNEWLSNAELIPTFLAAMEDHGWIVRNAPPVQSRFWKLLDGDHAEMFGVFSEYELQVIQDWLRGAAASYDGATLLRSAHPGEPSRPRTFRAQQRLKTMRGDHAVTVGDDRQDADVVDLEQRLMGASQPDERINLLIEAMAPSSHWMPAGLVATRQFVDAVLR